MMLKHIEVEQKYQLPDPLMLKSSLREKDAKKLGSERQVDVYYNAPHRNFLAAANISEWLRIRTEEDGKTSINYKHWLPLKAKIKTHCDEYESAVQDGEALRKLFEALDFKKLITVDKQREEWSLDDIVIAIDEVKQLGWFVEFEYKGDATSVEQAHYHIEKTIAKLGVTLGERNHIGYPYLLITKKQK